MAQLLTFQGTSAEVSVGPADISVEVRDSSWVTTDISAESSGGAEKSAEGARCRLGDELRFSQLKSQLAQLTFQLSLTAESQLKSQLGVSAEVSVGPTDISVDVRDSSWVTTDISAEG